MVDEFIQALGRLSPDISVQVDASDDPDGETWIDIAAPGFSTSMSYRPAHGFGIYVSEAGYGEGPDEIYRVAETAARRVAQLCAHAADDGVAAGRMGGRMGTPINLQVSFRSSTCWSGRQTAISVSAMTNRGFVGVPIRPPFGRRWTRRRRVLSLLKFSR